MLRIQNEACSTDDPIGVKPHGLQEGRLDKTTILANDTLRLEPDFVHGANKKTRVRSV